MTAKIFSSTPRSAWCGIVLIRLMVGLVFLTEGLQKFIYPAVRGVGRFEAMGFPAPELWSSVVGAFEVVCGILLLAGFLTRAAAVPTFIIMCVAIVTTKVPILLGHGFGPFLVRDLSTYGFWSMTHAMRTDWSMLLGSLFLMISGGGPLSIDGRVFGRTSRTKIASDA